MSIEQAMPLMKDVHVEARLSTRSNQKRLQ